MDRSSSREDVDSVSAPARAKSVSTQGQMIVPQSSSIVELMRNHPIIKTLTHDKMQTLRKLMEESQRGRITKSLRVTCKSFIQKLPPASLDMLTDMTYRQFALFLRNQKRVDDQKMKKLARLGSDWEQERVKQSDWRSPLQKYFQHQKTRNTKKIWR